MGTARRSLVTPCMPRSGIEARYRMHLRESCFGISVVRQGSREW
jgi:hypothetical protein